MVPENDEKMTYIGEKTCQKCSKIFNKTLTDFSFDIPRRGMTKREVGGVVVVVRTRVNVVDLNSGTIRAEFQDTHFLRYVKYYTLLESVLIRISESEIS